MISATQTCSAGLSVMIRQTSNFNKINGWTLWRFKWRMNNMIYNSVLHACYVVKHLKFMWVNVFFSDLICSMYDRFFKSTISSFIFVYVSIITYVVILVFWKIMNNKQSHFYFADWYICVVRSFRDSSMKRIYLCLICKNYY